MSTALLLGIFCFLVAGTRFIRDRAVTKVEPVSEEACERLATAEDIRAVRAAFDDMLVRKGLLTVENLDLIRHGTKSRAVVTGMRTTGAALEDHREVELDVMVRK